MPRQNKNEKIDFSTPHNLTVGLINRATCPNSACYVLLKDAENNKLRLRITKFGKRWQFESRIKGKLVTKSLGAWPAMNIETARTFAFKLRAMADQGIDPREIERKKKAEQEQAQAERDRVQAEIEQAAHFTFEALMNDYCDHLTKNGRESHQKVRGSVKRHVIEAEPKVVSLPAAQVTGEQITDLLRRLRENGTHSTARRVRSYIHAAFEMARTARTDSERPVHLKKYDIRNNPAAETKPIKTEPDKNPLLGGHLRQYWKAIQKVEGVQGAWLRIHLLTGGQRLEQLRLLRIKNIGSDSFTIYDSKGTNPQNPRAHVVPLIGLAKKAMDEILALNGNGEYACSINGGTSPIAKDRLAKWAVAVGTEIKWETVQGKPFGVFKAKRIRSGVETCLAGLKVSQEVRGHLLSHGVPGVQAASYDQHDYLDVKKDALNEFYKFLKASSLDESPPNVTHISRGRKAA